MTLTVFSPDRTTAVTGVTLVIPRFIMKLIDYCKLTMLKKTADRNNRLVWCLFPAESRTEPYRILVLNQCLSFCSLKLGSDYLSFP